MKLEELLSQRQSTILKKWLQRILETYPGDTQRFLKKQKDQFANPVGFTISKETERLYGELLKGIDSERVSPILDRIIRIRAVQDFTPSGAISLIFQLKDVIRRELDKEIQENRLFDELLMFESRIDGLALLAFNIYMKSREKLYAIRANQAKKQVSKLLERAGLIAEIPEWQPNHEEDNEV